MNANAKEVHNRFLAAKMEKRYPANWFMYINQKTQLHAVRGPEQLILNYRNSTRQRGLLGVQKIFQSVSSSLYKLGVVNNVCSWPTGRPALSPPVQHPTLWIKAHVKIHERKEYISLSLQWGHRGLFCKPLCLAALQSRTWIRTEALTAWGMWMTNTSWVSDCSLKKTGRRHAWGSFKINVRRW